MTGELVVRILGDKRGGVDGLVSYWLERGGHAATLHAVDDILGEIPRASDEPAILAVMHEPLSDNPQLATNLAGIPWKKRVKILKACVEDNHKPLELPPFVRRWLELNRSSEPETAEQKAHQDREIKAIQWWIDAKGDEARWFLDKMEFLPISGWVITAVHFLLDGKRWWLVSGQRHDDAAPLVGKIVPAPANKADLRRLAKIIDYAGGNSNRELLRTGAITQEEHDDFVARGKHDIAEYGMIFYWWRA